MRFSLFIKSILLRSQQSKVLYIHLLSRIRILFDCFNYFLSPFKPYFDDVVSQILLWSNRKLVFFSTSIIFLSSVAFGVWFKVKQISIASEKIVGLYPLANYVISVVQTLLIFIALWLGLGLISISMRQNKVDRVKRDLFLSFFLSALPFASFFLSAFDVNFSIQVGLFFCFSAVFLFFKVFKNEDIWRKIKEPTYVFLMFFFVFFFLVESLSPVYHTSFSDVHGMKSFLLNYEHQWENAKAYDFLGNFSHQSRLGGYSQGIFFVSELSALIALIFDVPIVT